MKFETHTKQNDWLTFALCSFFSLLFRLYIYIHNKSRFQRIKLILKQKEGWKMKINKVVNGVEMYTNKIQGKTSITQHYWNKNEIQIEDYPIILVSLNYFPIWKTKNKMLIGCNKR